MTEDAVQEALGRLSGGLMDHSGINLETDDWHRIAGFLARSDDARRDLESAMKYYAPVTADSITEWLFTHEPKNADARLALARMKTLDIIMKCYTDDGKLEEILLEVVKTGGVGTDEMTLGHCLESMLMNYKGNGLSCSLGAFLMLEWDK
jgi:hypothetical protein